MRLGAYNRDSDFRSDNGVPERQTERGRQFAIVMRNPISGWKLLCDQRPLSRIREYWSFN